MIKRLIDSLRGRDGYAGMAIYREGTPIYCDLLDPGLADGHRRLFEESEAIFNKGRMAAVARGFTVSAFRAGGLLVVCRYEGRFARPAAPPEEEPEYSPGPPEAHLMAREEAKREAGLILRRLLGAG